MLNLKSILFTLLFFFFTPFFPHDAGANITENLVAHYGFEEGSGNSVYDSSPNNHNGEVTGALWTSGRIGGGLFFDGQDDRVDMGSFDITGSAATFMAWIYIDDFTGTSSDGRILSKADGTQENGHYWMLSTINSGGTKLRFRLKTDGATTTLIGGDVSSGEWVHMAAVYDGSTMMIYRNGVEVASTAKSGAISQNSGVHGWIGDQPPTSGMRPWHGKIDEVRIYENALTVEEILQCMNNGNNFPEVTLSEPADGQNYPSGSDVTLEADASDSDGSITRVEFYAGENLIGEVLNDPYTITWQNPADGTYSITAKAIDNEDSFSFSQPPKQITVGDEPTDVWVHKSTVRGDLETPTDNGNQQTASLVLDINNDGITDFVITDRATTPSVVWYQSSDSGSWIKHLIDPDLLRIEAGGTYADIDGDGDLDLLFGGDGASNEIWWWENPYPDFTQRWVRRIVKNSGANKYHDQMFGDFDGDGRKELASWNQNASQLILFEIPADPGNTQPWPYTVIAPASGSHEGMAVFDVDGDGVEDIVGAGRWYKHSGSQNYEEYLVDSSQTFGRAAAGQFIPGGYGELIFGPGDSSGDLKFYQYNGTGWDETLLKADVDHGHSLHTGDFNGDNNLDIFCAEMRLNGGNSDAKMWIFHGDGAGNFQEYVVAEGFGNHESRPADLDGDGDLDILGKPYNWDAPRLDIWLKNGTGSFSLNNWQRHLIDNDMGANAVFIESGDMDGDHHADLITGGWWYKNPGLPGGTWTRQAIGSPLNNMAVIHDFDNDGDLDVLGTTGVGSSTSHDFRWARNDGSGNFTILDNVQTGGAGDFLQGAKVVDFAGGKQVVLSWHNGGGGIHSLYVPADPSTEAWSFNTLTATTQAEDISAGDIDNDGDIDLLLGTVWLENGNGVWTSHTLGEVSDLHAGATPDRNSLVDIDGDGLLDSVVALENGTSVLWFKAPQDPTGLWERNIVGNVAGQGFSMDTADFDQDGDQDIVVGEHRGSSLNRVILFENRESGSEWIQHIVDSDSASTIDHHDGTKGVDIDNDGDTDILSIGWYNTKVWIYENRSVGNSTQLPVITQHPVNSSVLQGQTVILSVSATSSSPLIYQWQKNGINIPYATDPSYITPNLGLADNGNSYSCTVRNEAGGTVSTNGVVSIIPVTGESEWWNENWSYRVPVTIFSAGHVREDFPFSFAVNFTQYFRDLSETGGFNIDSLRVVEVNSTGATVNEQVAFQFDESNDYDSISNAAGLLTILVPGTTGSAESRFFDIYFDTTDHAHSTITVPDYLGVSNTTHKGFSSYRIDTQNSTYFFHRSGAGFATLLDSDNQDWVGFQNDSSSGASGWYRGIPNAIYPEDMMHPGRNGCESTLLRQGPLVAEIESECSEWRSVWKIYPFYATMRMESVAHDYWFQYEGTPGGTTDATDFITTSSNETTTGIDEWTSDIQGDEWVYLGDNDHNRVLFVAHHESDEHPDRFYRMQGGGGDGMFIFAYGRGSGTDRFLDAVPQNFTIGFLESKDFSYVSSRVPGRYQSGNVVVGEAEGLARAVVTSNQIYFGDVLQGGHSERDIVLTNSGSIPLVVGIIGASDTLAAPFSIIHDGCGSRSLLPYESCTITIRFSPSQSGEYSDSFDIPTNATNSPIVVHLHSGFRPFPWVLFLPSLKKNNND